jgi:hypothetical protein
VRTRVRLLGGVEPTRIFLAPHVLAGRGRGGPFAASHGLVLFVCQWQPHFPALLHRPLIQPAFQPLRRLAAPKTKCASEQPPPRVLAGGHPCRREVAGRWVQGWPLAAGHPCT